MHRLPVRTFMYMLLYWVAAFRVLVDRQGANTIGLSGNRPYMFQLFRDVPGLCRIALEFVRGRPFENLSQGTARQATLLMYEVLG